MADVLATARGLPASAVEEEGADDKADENSRTPPNLIGALLNPFKWGSLLFDAVADKFKKGISFLAQQRKQIGGAVLLNFDDEELPLELPLEKDNKVWVFM